ncbi:hypothetical protein H4R35_005556 [Dimargaris xerosporica]|nr:hypothetical protein H4R35_005556 [Dimargaris xerosporica]
MKPELVYTLVRVLLAPGPLIVVASGANQGTEKTAINWRDDYSGYYRDMFVTTDGDDSSVTGLTPEMPDQPISQESDVEAHDQQQLSDHQSAPALVGKTSWNTQISAQGLTADDSSGDMLPNMAMDSAFSGSIIPSTSTTSSPRKTWLGAVKNKVKHAIGLTAKQNVYRVLNVAAIRAIRNQPPRYDDTLFFPNKEILYGVKVLPYQDTTGRGPSYRDKSFQFVPYATRNEAILAVIDRQVWAFFTVAKDGGASGTDQLWRNSFINQPFVSFSMASNILGKDVQHSMWTEKSIFY